MILTNLLIMNRDLDSYIWTIIIGLLSVGVSVRYGPGWAAGFVVVATWLLYLGDRP
jgi:hypothetical protein